MSTRQISVNLVGRPVDLPSWVPRLFGVLLGVVGWFALASVFPGNLMPYPQEALLEAWKLVEKGIVVEHLSATLLRTIIGFTGALLIGGTFGILMGMNDYGRMFFTPYVIAGLSVPAIAWAAMMTLIFGFNLTAPVGATILTVFPYIAVNIWKGVENIDAQLLDMSQAFNVSNRRMLFRSIVPNVAPSLFSAFRFGLAVSWKVVTVSEIFASGSGIGYKLIQAYNFYRFERAWAWAIVFIVVILFIEYAVFRPLERRVYEYRPDADFSILG